MCDLQSNKQVELSVIVFCFFKLLLSFLFLSGSNVKITMPLTAFSIAYCAKTHELIGTSLGMVKVSNGIIHPMALDMSYVKGEGNHDLDHFSIAYCATTNGLIGTHFGMDKVSNETIHPMALGMS